MFNWLHKMRGQPVHKRRLVAFGVALFLTGILFVFWLSVWLPNFFQTSTVADKNNSQFASPKDTFAQSFSNTWSSIVNDYSQLKGSLLNINLSSAIEYQSATNTEKTSH